MTEGWWAYCGFFFERESKNLVQRLLCGYSRLGCRNDPQICEVSRSKRTPRRTSAAKIVLITTGDDSTILLLGGKAMYLLLGVIEASPSGVGFLLRRGAWLNDKDRPFTQDIAIGKYFAGGAGVWAAGMAIEIHGGMGYSLEMPVEKYFRDSKSYQVGEETANIMRLLIANDALGIKKANHPRLHVLSDFRDLD